MASTTKTENYQLNQYSANDQPTWVGDYSGDMLKIDTALGNATKRTGDKFSETETYAVGNLCIKDDLLYKFTAAKEAGAWDETKVKATTIEAEFEQLNGDITSLSGYLVPQYNNFERLYDSTTDVTAQTVTIENDGWIQGIAKTAATQGTPFIRLYINSVDVWEIHAPTASYRYAWSPLFRVKKGDKLMYTLASATSDGNKELRLYKI